jgi:hypothetical protein
MRVPMRQMVASILASLIPVRGEAMIVSLKALQRPSIPTQESVHAKA